MGAKNERESTIISLPFIWLKMNYPVHFIAMEIFDVHDFRFATRNFRNVEIKHVYLLLCWLWVVFLENFAQNGFIALKHFVAHFTHLTLNVYGCKLYSQAEVEMF